MIRFSVPFIALMLAFSGTANAKFIGRWDPAAYAQGKFEIQKTAFRRRHQGVLPGGRSGARPFSPPDPALY